MSRALLAHILFTKTAASGKRAAAVAPAAPVAGQEPVITDPDEFSARNMSAPNNPSGKPMAPAGTTAPVTPVKPVAPTSFAPAAAQARRPKPPPLPAGSGGSSAPGTFDTFPFTE